jgi:hypothetical protein
VLHGELFPLRVVSDLGWVEGARMKGGGGGEERRGEVEEKAWRWW